MTLRIQHGNLEHANWFVVNWCLGNTCNFKCSYCSPGLHDGSVKWPDKDTVISFIQKMLIHSGSLGKKLYLELTGGEVTMWRHFEEVALFCKEHGVKLGIISNGSRTLRWWEENKHLFDHVCLSFHPEQAEVDHFLAVIKILRLELRTHVNIMMLPAQFNECYEVATKVKNIGNVSLALQPLIIGFGDTLYPYTKQQQFVFDNQYDLVVKHIKWTKGFEYYRGAMSVVDEANVVGETLAAHRFISMKENNWSGWECYAGVEQIIVDMDGSIHRGWCKVGGNLGTIQNPTFTLEPVVCNKTMCHCNYDIMSTKVNTLKLNAATSLRLIPVYPVA